jgi:hypothetical protein
MATTDVLFWKVLRRDLRLSRRETEQAITEIVEDLCSRGPAQMREEDKWRAF